MLGDRGTEALNRIGERIKALEEERDRWKGMAEKLAEALKKVISEHPRDIACKFEDGHIVSAIAGKTLAVEAAEKVISAYESALKEVGK